MSTESAFQRRSMPKPNGNSLHSGSEAPRTLPSPRAPRVARDAPTAPTNTESSSPICGTARKRTTPRASAASTNNRGQISANHFSEGNEQSALTDARHRNGHQSRSDYGRSRADQRWQLDVG